VSELRRIQAESEVIVQLQSHVSERLQVVEDHCELIGIHLGYQVLFGPKQLIDVIVLREDLAEVLVLVVLLREPLQIELRAVLYPELDAQFLQHHIVLLFLESDHEGLDLVALDEVIALGHFHLLLLVPLEEVVCLVLRHLVHLIEIADHALDLRVCKVDFFLTRARQQRIDDGALVHVLLWLLVLLVLIKLVADVDLRLGV